MKYVTIELKKWTWNFKGLVLIVQCSYTSIIEWLKLPQNIHSSIGRHSNSNEHIRNGSMKEKIEKEVKTIDWEQ